MMMDSAVIYPANLAVDERLKKFILRFYAISDDPSRDDEWVDCFAHDALFIIGQKTARGMHDIRRLRENMWEEVKSRKHRLDKVFPVRFEPPEGESEAPLEYMLHGSVDLERKNGETTTTDWAARAILGDGKGALKYALYQVYI